MSTTKVAPMKCPLVHQDGKISDALSFLKTNSMFDAQFKARQIHLDKMEFQSNRT